MTFDSDAEFNIHGLLQSDDEVLRLVAKVRGCCRVLRYLLATVTKVVPSVLRVRSHSLRAWVLFFITSIAFLKLLYELDPALALVGIYVRERWKGFCAIEGFFGLIHH
jgi:hypothetical protein